VFHVQVVEVDADGAAAEPAGAGVQEGQEPASHRVRREVVDGEVQLGAFAGGLPRGDHHAGIVDQRIEVIDGTLDLRRGSSRAHCSSNGRQIASERTETPGSILIGSRNGILSSW
jgi:hypothetical protein